MLTLVLVFSFLGQLYGPIPFVLTSTLLLTVILSFPILLSQASALQVPLLVPVLTFFRQVLSKLLIFQGIIY